MRWYQGMSYPVQSGAACIGCSNAHFWDEGPFTKRMPEYGPIADVDKIGAGLAVAAGVGVVAHGALSTIQKKKRQEAEQAEHDGKQVNK